MSRVDKFLERLDKGDINNDYEILMCLIDLDKRIKKMEEKNE